MGSLFILVWSILSIKNWTIWKISTNTIDTLSLLLWQNGPQWCLKPHLLSLKPESKLFPPAQSRKNCDKLWKIQKNKCLKDWKQQLWDKAFTHWPITILIDFLRMISLWKEWNWIQHSSQLSWQEFSPSQWANHLRLLDQWWVLEETLQWLSAFNLFGWNRDGKGSSLDLYLVCAENP